MFLEGQEEFKITYPLSYTSGLKKKLRNLKLHRISIEQKETMEHISYIYMYHHHFSMNNESTHNPEVLFSA